MEEIDRVTAVHEAAHAVVGTRLGWPLASVSVIPPSTQFKPVARQNGRQAMAMAMAGSVAEQISIGAPAADVMAAFDAALREFFDELGDEDIHFGESCGAGCGGSNGRRAKSGIRDR